METTKRNSTMRSEIYTQVKLNKRNANVEFTNEDVQVTLPNRFTFCVKQEVFSQEGENYVFSQLTGRPAREVLGFISDQDFQINEVDGKVILARSNGCERTYKSPIFSNHVDYQPRRRINIVPTPKVWAMFDCNSLDMIGDEGRIRRFSNFIFIPKNHLVLRFSRQTFGLTKISPREFYTARASVCRQDMSCHQIVETAAALASMQGMIFTTEDSLDASMSLWARAFILNCRFLTSARSVKFSEADVWKQLETIQDIIVPTFEVENPKDLVKRSKAYLDDKERLQYPLNEEGLKMFAADLDVPNILLSPKEKLDFYCQGKHHLLDIGRKELVFNLPRVFYRPIQTFDVQSTTDHQKLIQYLVEDRMKETNLENTLRRSLKFAERYCGDAVFNEFFERAISFDILSFYHPGLNKAFLRQDKALTATPPKHASEQVEFIKQHLQSERILCQIAQTEAEVWSRIFRFPQFPNIFNNVSYILKMAESRRKKPKVCSGDEGDSEESPDVSDQDEDSEDDEEEKVSRGIFAGAYSTVKDSFQAGKNFFANVAVLAKNSTNVAENFATMNQFVQERFSEAKMPLTAETFANLDFSSVSGTMSTMKMLVNSWFSDFIGKMCNLFGVEYTRKIDATTMIFYYLIWIKNDSPIIRWMIMLDIASTLGILDFVLTIIKKFASGVRSMFKPVDASFEEFIQNIEERSNALSERNVSSVGKAQKSREKAAKKSKKEEETRDSLSGESWISWLLGHLSSGSIKVIALLGVTIVGVLGYKAEADTKNVYKRVANMMRNISFASLGLAAAPKIFETIFGAFSYAFDWIKGLVCEDHETKIQKMRKVEAWLETTPYILGVSENHFARNHNACLQFMTKFAEIEEIGRIVESLDNLTLARHFKERRKTMTTLYSVVDSMLTVFLGMKEPIHIQLYSPNCGVGKTDAAQEVLKICSGILREEESKVLKQLGIDKTREPKLEMYYPYNENLKHNDLYYGQSLLYQDEMFVFDTVESENVVTLMTMLSGFPSLSPQASIPDKGRLFQTKIMVSNTNTAYPQLKNMPKKDALLRRRILFKVTVRPNCADAEGNIDAEKLQKSGLNRTAGEHLLFSLMHNAEDKAISPDVEYLDVQKFHKLLPVLVRNRIVVEENRLHERDPARNLLRLEYEQLRESIQEAYSELDTKVDLKEVIRKLQSRGGKIDVRLASDAKKFSSFADTLTDEMDAAHSAFQPGTASGEVCRETLKKRSDGKYVLTRSLKAQMAEKLETFQHQCVSWDKDRPVLEVPDFDIDSAVGRTNLFWMCKYSLATSQGHFDRMKKIYVLESRGKSIAKTWRLKMRDFHHSLYEVGSSVTSWIYRNVVQTVGDALIQGCVLGITIGAMFFALSMIGQMCAPTPTPASYNQRYDQRRNVGLVLPASFNEDYSAMIQYGQKASYRAYVQTENSIKRCMIVGIQGSQFLINRHCLDMTQKKFTIWVYDHRIGIATTSDAVKAYEVPKSAIAVIPGRDACLIEIDGFRPVKTCLNHFVSEIDCEEELLNFKYGEYTSVGLREKEAVTIDKRFKGDREYFTSGFGSGHPCVYTGDYEHDRVIMFHPPRPNIVGDSGSLVIHSNPKISSKFVGIVISIGVETGHTYAGVITQEMLRSASQKLSFRSKIVTVPKEAVQLAASDEYMSVFDFNDRVYVSPIQGQGISKSLGFQKSSIHGIVPVDTQPAIQDSRDPRIPQDTRHFLKVSLNKSNGLKDPEYTLEEAKFMKKYLKRAFTKYVGGLHTVRVYSTRHAITGIKSMGSTSMDTKTSAGLPYKNEKGVQGKKPFIIFNDIEQCWQISQRVFDDTERYQECYENARIPFGYKLEFRKKELVPDLKISNPKTRTVGTGNFIHQIVYNKIYKDLYTQVKNSWILGESCPFAIGIDQERHWNQVATHLKYVDCVYDFDVKAWEEKICLKLLNLSIDVKMEILREAYAFRKEKFPEEVQKWAEGLAVDYMDTDVIFEHLMYSKNSGLLSGHPGTFMENSEIHEMISGLVFKRILEKYNPAWGTVEFIHEHIRTIKAADDIQIALSPLARYYIKAEDLRQGYEKLGFEITAADKSDDIRSKHLEDSQFLKHGFFCNEDGTYQAVPKESIINQLLNWIRDDTELTVDKQFSTNLQNAMRFAFWRGRDYYEHLRHTVNVGLRSTNREWIFDYDDMKTIIKSDILEADRLSKRFAPQTENELTLYD